MCERTKAKLTWGARAIAKLAEGGHGSEDGADGIAKGLNERKDRDGGYGGGKESSCAVH